MGRKPEGDIENYMCARNTTFDMFKGIACIGIVLIHSKFPEPLGTGFQATSRIGAISKSIDCGYPIVHSI